MTVYRHARYLLLVGLSDIIHLMRSVPQMVLDEIIKTIIIITFVFIEIASRFLLILIRSEEKRHRYVRSVYIILCASKSCDRFEYECTGEPGCHTLNAKIVLKLRVEKIVNFW